MICRKAPVARTTEVTLLSLEVRNPTLLLADMVSTATIKKELV